MEDNKYNIQQDSSEYTKETYMTDQRWSSYSTVIRETIKLKPRTILEIGPGNFIVTEILKRMGFDVKTLDFDPDVKSDYNFSITDDQLGKLGRFDLVIASQILEHVRYDDFIGALKKLSEITTHLLMTLPHTTTHSLFFSLCLKVPLFKKVMLAKKITFKKVPHRFNGLHYWEIGKKEYPLGKIKNDILKCGWRIENDFLNPENPYHYFFILRKND